MTKNHKTLVSISIVILIVAGIYTFSSSDQESSTESTTNTSNNQTTMEETTPGTTELKKEILKEGTGEAAKFGDTVTVHYTGTLTDGSKFDSSVDRGEPFSFTIGEQMVIDGWEQGVAGMKVGEKSKLTIPYQMAYGEAGRPPVIPAKATLIFEIELLKIN